MKKRSLGIGILYTYVGTFFFCRYINLYKSMNIKEIEEEEHETDDTQKFSVAGTVLHR